MNSYQVYTKPWRKRNRDLFNLMKKRNYAKGAEGVTKTKQPWTDSEIDEIVASDRPCDRILAKKISRSVQAIQVMRSRLRKISL